MAGIGLFEHGELEIVCVLGSRYCKLHSQNFQRANAADAPVVLCLRIEKLFIRLLENLLLEIFDKICTLRVSGIDSIAGSHELDQIAHTVCRPFDRCVALRR